MADGIENPQPGGFGGGQLGFLEGVNNLGVGNVVPAPTSFFNCPNAVGLGLLTGSRGTIEYGQWADGHWSSFAINTIVVTDLGCQFWQNSANYVVFNRDLTNAVWTKTSATTAENATGIDNVASAATTLIATGANATAIQAITLASAMDAYSVFLKGVTVTGAITITLDNFSHSTTCSVNTITFTRCSVVTASTVNPTVGIKVANSGDSIVIDASQLENIGRITPPIMTTGTTPVTRGNDVWGPAGALLTALEGESVTLLGKYSLTTNSNASTGRSFLFNQSDAGNARLNLRVADVSGNTEPEFVIGDGTTNSTLNDITVSAGSTTNAAITWAVSPSSILAAFAMQGRAAVTANRQFGATVTSAASIGASCDCFLTELDVWTPSLPAAFLPVITNITTSQSSTGPVVAIVPKQADQFVDSIGINSELSFTGSLYFSAFSGTVLPAVEALGIRHYRDGMNLATTDGNYAAATANYVSMCAQINDLDAGIPTLHFSTIGAALTAEATFYSNTGTCIKFWEGTNEADAIQGPIYMGNGWPLGAVEWQNDLYSTFHGTASVGASNKILLTSVTNNNFSVGYQTWCATAGASCPMTNADLGNLHAYAGSTYPSFGLPQNIVNGELPATTPGNIYDTEYGYFTAGPAIGTFDPVSENAQAKYTERGTFEFFNAGIARSYIFELLDSQSDPGDTNAQYHFGLVRSDGSYKPGFTTVENLITLLADAGVTFSPSTVHIGSYQGNPSLHSAILQKRTGITYACYWLEVNSYNTSTQMDISVPPVTDIITLTDSWSLGKLWRPYQSSSPIATYSSPTSVTLQVPDDVECLELDP